VLAAAAHAASNTSARDKDECAATNTSASCSQFMELLSSLVIMAASVLVAQCFAPFLSRLNDSL
jgi:predicted lysophospholipase L1 biosynthesis ABC-type transport system permease subunit